MDELTNSFLKSLYIEGIPPALLACQNREDIACFYGQELACIPEVIRNTIIDDKYTQIILKKIQLKRDKHPLYLLLENILSQQVV